MSPEDWWTESQAKWSSATTRPRIRGPLQNHQGRPGLVTGVSQYRCANHLNVKNKKSMSYWAKNQKDTKQKKVAKDKPLIFLLYKSSEKIHVFNKDCASCLYVVASCPFRKYK